MRGTMGGRRRGAAFALALLCTWGVCVDGASAAPPQIAGTTVSGVTSATATLEATVNPGGKATTYRFELGTSNCSTSSCKSLPPVAIPAGALPVPIEATVKELSPGTIYHFRVIASNGEGGQIKGPDFAFATSGIPADGLPDARAYEQSSPLDKDGGDVVGKLGLVKAADDGNGINFGSTFGIPGGKGAEALPSYLALRGVGESGWATQGLLPPPVFGERAQVQGWLPDFSKTYSNVAKLGSPRKKAFVEQSTSGGPATIVSPYTPKAEYSYVGTTPDASVVFFESEAKLPPEEGGEPIEGAIAGTSNLYAWSRASGKLSLAGALNKGEGDAPPKGAFAGPYDWSKGTNASTLRTGGAARGYYLQGTHAVGADGNVYFTEAGTGQLYLRLNPTRPQSEMEGEKCKEPAAACTVHVSASKRGKPDPAGAQPAAFQAASTNGSGVFFTSSEMLTDDANTGPEQPEASIGASASASGAIEDPALIKRHALGVAVEGSHIYWADPSNGTIGRANLDGSNTENFIEVPPSECEEIEPGVFAQVPSKPRYVAVDAGHIYWTNTGKLDEDGEPAEGGGTIGRADIDGSETSIEPGFICGASNPQGIAVNATHIYWAKAAKDPVQRSLARAAIDGSEVEPEFHKLFTNNSVPYGIALNANHVYFAFNEGSSNNGYLERMTLGGGESTVMFISKVGIRGVAVDGANIYWAAQGEETVGRVPISDFGSGSCAGIITCEKEFAKGITGALNGLAVDASHLYWSVNGEAPTNPGNDLYRYEPEAGSLEDLTPLLGGNGAEVQGVLGASPDGSYVYFAANGVLGAGGKATQGNCQTTFPHGSLSSTSGSCNVYLWHGGTISFVGRVKGPDATSWTGTPREAFSNFVAKTAFVSEDGQTLLFRSQEKLSDYESEGAPELYRYRSDTGEIACVSCRPSGEAVGKGPSLGTDSYPGPVSPPLGSVGMVESRNLSADGNRAFFETTETLVPADTNGEAACVAFACLDVYEWEAPNTGSCTQGGPAYSPLNAGCIYLISTGTSEFPSYFADASQNGGDVFFFTRQGLVGQDKDELQDVYDARVGGGLSSQNPVTPVPCESTEACHGPGQEPPTEASPGSATFVGPADPKPKHRKPAKHKTKKHKAKKQKGGHAKRKGRR
jgi:hypothetical protein